MSTLFPVGPKKRASEYFAPLCLVASLGVLGVIGTDHATSQTHKTTGIVIDHELGYKASRVVVVRPEDGQWQGEEIRAARGFLFSHRPDIGSRVQIEFRQGGLTGRKFTRFSRVSQIDTPTESSKTKFKP